MSLNLALIGLGANLSSSAGSPAHSLRFALRLISREAGLTLASVSKIYLTAAFPAGSGPDYANACAALRTSLSPDEVLGVLHRIEAEMGRHRDGTRWGARPIDIDLLAMGDTIAPDAAVHDGWRTLPLEKQMQTAPDRLVLPHPRLQDRAFVLIPLSDIAGGWRHPRTGLTVHQMLERLPTGDRAGIRVLLDISPDVDQVTGSALSDSNR
ncbi:2-amino-4-hydroxy-6-hydroxymethyldihydropteridine diphosphokinase [Paracoccus albus]|uniref:2-amino-4-hydroxy-6- hydroxymethyldihydropteridine diphosphokinase n=1 Tax=Paracoccus albus TaxID=3017784 RepID=UPI0022F08844|nr:2-amino-4-hydroxy-6-hydroxymethyldihydropteridine diphosphokinase [Paracoccus albus]WBU61031.1 2-amino-4-hydroxy-6-hydroxymethyldihydropteridine diphosphokinase [Paracoccus albus]